MFSNAMKLAATNTERACAYVARIPAAISGQGGHAATYHVAAVLVHGFVNKDGRFEELAVTFPPEFPQAQFVLNSLAQWQFRPAAQNGQPVKVEILLIIPDTQE